MRERIIKVMNEKEINSMAELERRAGVPSGTMRNMGQGHMPSMDKVRKIANTLGVSVDYIVNGIEKPESTTAVQGSLIKESEPLKGKGSDVLREFMASVASLSDQNMEALLDYLKYLVGKQERD